MIDFKKFMHASIPTLNFSFPTSGLISKKTVLNVIPVFGGSDKLSDYILLILTLIKLIIYVIKCLRVCIEKQCEVLYEYKMDENHEIC